MIFKVDLHLGEQPILYNSFRYLFLYEQQSNETKNCNISDIY